MAYIVVDYVFMATTSHQADNVSGPYIGMAYIVMAYIVMAALPGRARRRQCLPALPTHAMSHVYAHVSAHVQKHVRTHVSAHVHTGRPRREGPTYLWSI